MFLILCRILSFCSLSDLEAAAFGLSMAKPGDTNRHLLSRNHILHSDLRQFFDDIFCIGRFDNATNSTIRKMNIQNNCTYGLTLLQLLYLSQTIFTKKVPVKISRELYYTLV